MSEIIQTKKELLDCIHNLMALVDTPIGRRQIKGKFADEVRDQARSIMKDNNRAIYNES